MHPFTGSIIGSWENTGDTGIEHIIYHFATDGRTHWESHWDGKYWINQLAYRLSGSTLTIAYSKPEGSERDFALQEEPDGSLCFLGVNDRWCRLKRMAEPQPFSKAFVGEDGVLKML